MGIIPGNVGGFGDAAKAAEVFGANELKCIRSSLLSVNERAGEEVIRFREYKLGSATVDYEKSLKPDSIDAT
ncbi:hypothetical protein [Pseudoalteromonas luteoviolacea]|uniref:hypothetical protein n=1 Tax=Pseudoalteromonas luteoviolacea TaxID=43657 RepID=UPI001154AB5B|nr:hypothetical protein [Pseudoalteromonas luteoviolacea]TQF71311.1 hypothetical protein FLM44_09525 [Pseudoalteromonas luteoviolacea]